MASMTAEQVTANIQAMNARLDNIAATVTADSATLTANSAQLNAMLPTLRGEIAEVKTRLIATVAELSTKLGPIVDMDLPTDLKKLTDLHNGLQMEFNKMVSQMGVAESMLATLQTSLWIQRSCLKR